MQRLVRGIVAGILLLSLYGCQALQQVDKGLFQVAEAISEEDRVTGQRSLSLAGRTRQIAQGNRYVQQLLENEKKAGRKVDAALDKKQYHRLVTIFDRIHASSHLRAERWQPVLIDRGSFNAFTTGGTYIVVHRGLMQQLKSDDELAAVLGHEIAHTVANHVFERQTHAQVSALAGSKSARKGSYQAAFTHESEREADRVGILYSALAGYDPMAASRIWARQYKLEGNARALFAHDHPVNAERQRETAKVGQQVKSYYQKGKQNPQYKTLLSNNVLWQQHQSAKAGSGGGLEALLGTALGAYAQHHQAKQEAQRQENHAGFVKAIESRMTLLQSRALNAQTLETQWQYKSGPVLKQVVMGLLIKKGNKTLRTVAHIPGYLKAGARYKARFTLPKGVTTTELKKLQGRFYLDDALPAQ
ncbi:MAG: M48 family metallopeptidase [Pontibacterium sp.]